MTRHTKSKNGAIKPDQQDFDAVEKEYGPLPPTADRIRKMLPQIESDVKIATLVLAIGEVKERFAAVADAVDPMPAGFAELTQSTLQALDQRLNEEIFQKLTSSVSNEDRALGARLRAGHRAKRGVKKVRGAK